MKKLTSFLTVALMTIVCLSFTSCDKDADRAYTLDGVWKGNMYIWYGDYESTYSIIEFDQESITANYGTGRWIDYYDTNYWSGHNYTPSRRFEWSVRNGNIYISFYDGSSNITIYNYTLSDNYFSGTMDAANGNRVTFSLSKYGNAYNWNDYSYDKTPASMGAASTDSIKPQVIAK